MEEASVKEILVEVMKALCEHFTYKMVERVGAVYGTMRYVSQKSLEY